MDFSHLSIQILRVLQTMRLDELTAQDRIMPHIAEMLNDVHSSEGKAPAAAGRRKASKLKQPR